MKNFRMQTHAIRAAMLSALLSGAAVAQGGKPVGPPVVTMKPAGPPGQTKGTVQSNPNADKGQATAEAARAEARERKATKSAFDAAHREFKSLHKGIKFTSAEKKAYRDVEKRYDADLKALEKSDRDAHRAREVDAMIVTRIADLRTHRRALLRAELSPDQRIRFDINVAALDGR